MVALYIRKITRRRERKPPKLEITFAQEWTLEQIEAWQAEWAKVQHPRRWVW